MLKLLQLAVVLLGLLFEVYWIRTEYLFVYLVIVVVNQMLRSPGVFFYHDKVKNHASGKLLFNCRVIPNRGSWLDFEYDVKDFLYFKIDRKKKIFSSTLLLALGYTKSEIVDEFYESEQYTFDPKT